MSTDDSAARGAEWVTEDEAGITLAVYRKGKNLGLTSMRDALTAFLAARGVASAPVEPTYETVIATQPEPGFAGGVQDARTAEFFRTDGSIDRLIAPPPIPPTQRAAQAMANRPPPPDIAADLRALAERVEALEAARSTF